VVSSDCPRPYVLENHQAQGIGDRSLPTTATFTVFVNFPWKLALPGQQGAAIAREGLLAGRDDQSVLP